MTRRASRELFSLWLTGKLSPDEGLQVQEDVLSDTHFQLIRSKVSFKIISAFSLLYRSRLKTGKQQATRMPYKHSHTRQYSLHKVSYARGRPDAKDKEQTQYDSH